MEKIYSRINWKNKDTSKTTPLNSTNLNRMDKAIDDIDTRVVEMASDEEQTSEDLSAYKESNDAALEEIRQQETSDVSELRGLITQIPKFDIVVVQTLPTENISPMTVYLVPNNLPGTNDLYDEYIYVNSKWEHLGSQTIDLSNYMPKSGGTFTGAIFGNYEEEDNWMIDPNGEAEFYQVRVGSGGIEGNLDGIASKATADGDGNDISSTYAKKADEPSEETIDIDFSNLFN